MAHAIGSANLSPASTTRWPTNISHTWTTLICGGSPRALGLWADEIVLSDRRAQPAAVEHFFGAATVDMRADQFLVRMGSLPVFVFTVLGPILRQISLLDDVVAEQVLIGAVGNAQHIVETLRGRAVHVGETRHRGWRSCPVCLGLVGVGDAPDQPARLDLAEL